MTKRGPKNDQKRTNMVRIRNQNGSACPRLTVIKVGNTKKTRQNSQKVIKKNQKNQGLPKIIEND